MIGSCYQEAHALRDCRRLLVVLTSGLGAAAAFGVEFDAEMLRQGSAADLTRFEQETVVPEGNFSLDLVLNQQWKGRHMVQLRDQPKGGLAKGCYSETLLQELGLEVQQLASEVRDALAVPGACLELNELKLVASESLDFNNLRMDLQIAQEALHRQPAGYLPPEQWDSGVTSGFVDYSFNLYEHRDLHQNSDSRRGFLGVRSGFNIGDWYWRHDGSWSGSSTSATRYKAGSTSVRTDIPDWSAQLTLGDGYSRADVFPSSAVRGVLLGSDERMLPPELRGFAPTVRGVANSTALVSIRQRGVLLHESTVPPGPFEIDDLLASGSSDDLEVTLKEADGSVRTFIQPNQVAPLSLRPGASRFEFASGVWRSNLAHTGPSFVQGSWQQGLNNHLSLHGGAWLAEDYLASAMGVAINSKLGAFGLTRYQSRSKLPSEKTRSGRAVRLNWRQRLGELGTDLGATLTQSDSAHYITFDELAHVAHRGQGYSSRRRLQLSLHQRLGKKGGSLNLTATNRQRWRDKRASKGYSLGYSNSLGAFTYGLSINRELDALGRAFTTYAFNASLPIGEQRRGSLSSGVNVNSDERSSSNLRWSAVGGDQQQWGYGLAASQQKGGRNEAGVDANLRHSSSTGEITGSLASRRGYRQASVGAQGSAVAHSGGVIGAPRLGESFAIVHAPGANKAGIQQSPQVRLNARGFAVVPRLQPYTLNKVDLNPKGMSEDVELQLSGQSVVPRAGATPLLHYPTRTGRLQMLWGRLSNGKALPFGALVFDEQGKEQGMVGQGGQLYVRSDDEQSRWRVVWGEAAEEQCWTAPHQEAGAEQALLVCT